MDTIIIGGGCMGASIAYYLAARGESGVLLLERGGVATGNTGKSGSIVRQHYSTPATARMALRGLRVFQGWREQVGGECGFQQTGLIVLAGEADAPSLAANVAMQQGVGIRTELVGLAEVAQIEPRLALDNVALACWEPEAGYADPIATTGAFIRRARDLGATVRLGTTVTALRCEGDRVVGVETAGGFIPAGRVILATNVWANELLAPLGATLPIAPSRHAILALRRPPDFGPPHPALFALDRQLYVRPDGAAFTLVGSSDPADAELPADPDHYHEGLDDGEVAQYRAGGTSLLPALAQAVVRGGWAGVYDVTPDWQPIIGPAPTLRNLTLAVGFSGHGFKLSPVVGEWVAELLLAGACPDLAPYSPARFTDASAMVPTSRYGVLG